MTDIIVGVPNDVVGWLVRSRYEEELFYRVRGRLRQRVEHIFFENDGELIARVRVCEVEEEKRSRRKMGSEGLKTVTTTYSKIHWDGLSLVCASDRAVLVGARAKGWFRYLPEQEAGHYHHLFDELERWEIEADEEPEEELLDLCEFFEMGMRSSLKRALEMF